MKRVLVLIVALWLVCIGVIGGVHTLGHHMIGWPFNFFGMRDLPDKDATTANSGTIDEDIFPAKVGDFSRATFGLPNFSDGRVLYSFTAQYFPPSGDPLRESVFVTAAQYSDAVVANIFIDPANLRLHSPTTNIYFAPAPFVYSFQATSVPYRDYVIKFINGRWNITIECANDRFLIAFVNQYRH